MFIRLYAPEGELDGGGGAESTETSATETAAPLDMDQTIRETYAKLKGDTPTRDATGKFAAKAAETLATAPVEGEQPAIEGTTETPTPAENTNPDNLEYTDNAGQKRAINIAEPPLSLRPEAKAEWMKWPEQARREMHKREHDFHNGVQQYKTAANFAVSIGNEFKPYEALLRSQNHTPQALTKDMMNSHYRLSTGDTSSKVSELVRVAGLYNLTVNDLQAALATVQSGQPVQQTPPEVRQLQERLDRMERDRTAAEESAIQADIKRFESDGKHEFFKLVAPMMGALISSGQESDMQAAYDKAIWSHPEVRAKLLAKQAEADRKTAADKAAAARKAASVNVVARGKHPATAPVGSMEDTIRAEYRRLNGGA